MRLTSQGEQPLDKYIRFKQNINQWYDEMDLYGLSEKEKQVLESHLDNKYGVCDTQEGFMQLILDESISGFDLTEANKFRKAVASKKAALIEHYETVFYEKGKEQGTSQAMLDYVWKEQITPQLGYAFSSPHIYSYTLILMIEMNICYRYGPVYWKTACLSVDAGLIGDDSQGTDYGSVAKAVGDMREDVKSPDINKSELGFVPLEEENKILFGLKPIVGVGMDAIQFIIDNRPYNNMDDFYSKVVDSGQISHQKLVMLIKAGILDNISPYRKQTMVDFVRYITPKKEKLTMTQLPHVLHLADKKKYKHEIELYQFRQQVFGRNKVSMNTELEKHFLKSYASDVKYAYDSKGKLDIDKKSFENMYKKAIEPLKEWIVQPEVADEYNKIQMRDFWKKHCLGSIEQWEMESTNFYHNKHEMDNMPLKSYFKELAAFDDLPEEPIQKGNNKRFPKYELSVIAGTVVEKDNAKSLVYLSTQYGVVMMKVFKGQFAYYDKKVTRLNGEKKEVIDPSWFDRGTKLVVLGFRRGNTFIPNKNGSSWERPILKITGYDKDQIQFQLEKLKE